MSFQVGDDRVSFSEMDYSVGVLESLVMGRPARAADHSVSDASASQGGLLGLVSAQINATVEGDASTVVSWLSVSASCVWCEITPPRSQRHVKTGFIYCFVIGNLPPP